MYVSLAAKGMTGRGFLSIHTYMHQNLMKMQKPSQGDGFWVSSAKSPHRQGGFETQTYSRQLIVMLVRMFQKSCACGGFFRTPLPVEGFWMLSWYVCMCAELHGQRDSGPPYPLNVKYWKVFVRNRTSSPEHDCSQTCIQAWYIHTSLAYIHTRSTCVFPPPLPPWRSSLASLAHF